MDAPKIQRVNNFDQLYAGRFLKAGDLDGKKVTLTIEDVYREELVGDDGAKMKVILTFKGKDRALVACKTNGFCIKAMFGSQVADWKGKRITIFADNWNGEPCIRVWGSPDLERDVEVTITLPRRKPIQKTLRKVTTNGAAKAPTKSEDVEPPIGALADDREPGTEG